MCLIHARSLLFLPLCRTITKQVQVSTPQALQKEKVLVFPDSELDVAVVYDAEGYNKVREGCEGKVRTCWIAGGHIGPKGGLALWASKADDKTRHLMGCRMLSGQTLAASAHTARPGQGAKHVGKAGSSVAGSSRQGARARAAAAVTQQRRLWGGGRSCNSIVKASSHIDSTVGPPASSLDVVAQQVC